MKPVIYLIFSVLIMFMYFYIIYKTHKEVKIRKSLEIIKLNIRPNFSMLIGGLYLVLTVIMIFLISDSILKSFIPLKGKYIDNLYQIYDFNFIEGLRNYFFENNMISELFITVRFLKGIPYQIFMFIFVIMNSALYLYKGFMDNIIYEGGITIDGSLYKWNSILGFDWGKQYEKKNKYYCDLIINLPKLFGLNADKSIRINSENKDEINEILKNKIFRSNEQ